MGEKDLDALMTVYSEHDRDQGRPQEEIRNIGKNVFESTTKEVL